VGDALHTYA
jgi:hypothetical protein